jgi:hypothetical protein
MQISAHHNPDTKEINNLKIGIRMDGFGGRRRIISGG